MCKGHVCGTAEKFRRHLLDRKRMAMTGFEEVRMWLERGTEKQNVTVTCRYSAALFNKDWIRTHSPSHVCHTAVEIHSFSFCICYT